MTGASPIVERAAARVAGRRAEPGVDAAAEAERLDLVRSAAARWPGRVAVVDRAREATYAELDERVDAAAARLTWWGAGAGRAVLLVVRNDLPSVVVVHAALRAGAIALVVPVGAGRAQIADILAETAPAVAVAPASVIADGVLPDARPGWRTLDALDGGPPDDGAGVAVADPRPADEPSVVIFTSGTTSRPKGVVHSLATLLAASRGYAEHAALDADDRLFVVSPLASITGVLQCVTVPAMLGARVVLETRWDAGATCDLLLATGGTFFGGPDLLLDRLLDEVEARGGSDTTIGAVYLGGAMLDPRILRRVDEDFGIVVLRAYGSSEAPISTAGHRAESRDVRLADDGAPLAGVAVRRGSSGDPSELCIAGPHLFLGYVDPDDDAHAFDVDADGRRWFRTGDVADLTGGRVKVTGRIKDIVIRNGLNVPIAEVEGHLNGLPGIARTAGYPVTDAVTGERLAVAVTAEDGAVIEFDEVLDGLRAAGLATWKLPEELVLWDEPFPENAAGKVLRNRLEAEGKGRPRLLAARLRETGA